MRSLSPTLVAAQQSALHEPVIQVIIDDRFAGMLRPRWSAFITAEDTLGPHVAAWVYDGSLVRARVDPTSGILFWQRITDHNNAAQWTAWTALDNHLATDGHIALASDGESRLFLFAVTDDRRTIRGWESANSGQSWQAGQTVSTLSGGHAVRGLGASLGGGAGMVTCVWADEGPDGVTLMSAQRLEGGGAWSAPLPWGRPSLARCSGLAVRYAAGAYRVAVAASDGLWVYGVPDNGWAAWPAPILAIAAQGDKVVYGWPSIGLALGNYWTILAVEQSSGVHAYERLVHVTTRDWVSISLFPRPHALPTPWGAMIWNDADWAYLGTAGTVWRAPLWTLSPEQRTDVSNDIMRLDLTEQATAGGRLHLTLRNNDGRYGYGRMHPAIRVGSQVGVRLGYRTAGGREVSFYRPYWITRLLVHRRHIQQGQSALVIEATDGWGILDRVRSPRTYTWVDTTVQAVLRDILGSFGVITQDDGGEVWSQPLPRYAITPGTTIGDEVRRLLAMVGGGLRFATHPDDEAYALGVWAHLVSGDQVSSYAYGDTHPILDLEDGPSLPEVVQVEVYGERAELSGEALDWNAIEALDQAPLHKVVDLRLTTADQCARRAMGELHAWQQAGWRGRLTVPPNVGQEVLDVVAISDGLSGLGGAERRVVGNRVLWDRMRGLFEQTLELEKP